MNFDLGDINSYTDLFFILNNVGDAPITQINVSVADSSFLVFPEEIDTLLSSRNIDLAELNEIPLI